MDEKRVLAFLRSSASAPVELAIEMANLTTRESIAIELCGRKGMTQDEAVEELQKGSMPRERDALHRWYRSGIKKLCRAWNGIGWIDAIIEYELRQKSNKST